MTTTTSRGRTLVADYPKISEAIGSPEVRALFDLPMLEASQLYDELIDAASWQILSAMSALPPQAGHDPDELVARRSLPERARPVLRALHAKLADAGFLRRVENLYFPGEISPPPFETAAEALTTRVPRAAVGAEVVRLLVDESPAFFAGERTGEEILFAPNRLPLWFRTFSNDNILYEINNTLGAEVLARALPETAAVVLEVGGGCGSAAQAALSRLGERVSRYLFTEIVPTFMRRGERAARGAASAATTVTSFRLDMTRPWAEQGVAPGSVDAVYAVNCFHVAPDLDFVLREARAALGPGGAVVLSECVRPVSPEQPTYVEFVFEFLDSFTKVETHPVRRPRHGFLTPAAWRASFAHAGFDEVTFVPDVETISLTFPRFYVAALIAR